MGYKIHPGTWPGYASEEETSVQHGGAGGGTAVMPHKENLAW